MGVGGGWWVGVGGGGVGDLKCTTHFYLWPKRVKQKRLSSLYGHLINDTCQTHMYKLCQFVPIAVIPSWCKCFWVCIIFLLKETY